MLRIGVLVSGRGSNLQKLIDLQRASKLAVSVQIVISNTSDAFAVERAYQAGVPIKVLPHGNFDSREAFERAITSTLEEHQVEVVVLAGFTRVLSREFIKHWEWKLIGIHPSLLPSFPGLRAQRQAIEYGVKFAGCTVFFVDEGADTGPIIQQSIVPVLPGDTELDLSDRILAEEHRILPQVLGWVAEGLVSVKNRKVVVATS